MANDYRALPFCKKGETLDTDSHRYRRANGAQPAFSGTRTSLRPEREQTSRGVPQTIEWEHTRHWQWCARSLHAKVPARLRRMALLTLHSNKGGCAASFTLRSASTTRRPP